MSQHLMQFCKNFGLRGTLIPHFEHSQYYLINPLAPGDFAEKRVLKVLEWFSGHCPAIKS